MKISKEMENTIAIVVISVICVAVLSFLELFMPEVEVPNNSQQMGELMESFMEATKPANWDEELEKEFIRQGGYSNDN